MKALSFRDRIEQYFRERPHRWIDGMELSHVGGCYAYRTRLSELRTQCGMTIENRLRRVGRRVVSEYRFVPPEPPADLLALAEREARA